MTTQITVRLDDELVEFIDGQVAGGRATSRAASVATALRREQRRLAAQHDAEIYASHAGEDDPDDLDALTAYASRTPMPDLD